MYLGFLPDLPHCRMASESCHKTNAAPRRIGGRRRSTSSLPRFI
jgi:hypothetical protein